MGDIVLVTERIVVELTRPQYVLQLRPRATIQVNVGGGGATPTIFTQATPLPVWSVSHNLGRFPLVRLKTLGTSEIEGEINHVSANQFTVTFNDPQAGQAIYI